MLSKQDLGVIFARCFNFQLPQQFIYKKIWPIMANRSQRVVVRNGKKYKRGRDEERGTPKTA